MSDRSGGNGDVKPGIPLPMLTITFDPGAYTVAIGGSVPSWEFAEAMLHMAAKETERKIHERRMQRRLEVSGPELLAQLTGRR